jgi:hypothetical protein
MSSLLEFLKKERKLSFIFWFKYYWNNILNTFYEKKVSSKIDNNWKKIKLSHSVVPEGYNSENAFSFLEKEYKGTNMKRFKD